MLKQSSIQKMISYEFLKKEYINNSKLVNEISKEFKLPETTIRRHLRKYRINPTELHKKKIREIRSNCMKELYKTKEIWNKGKKMSKEFCKKISMVQKGKKLTEEHKKNMREGHKGRKMPFRTFEHRRNLSKACKGKIISEESRKKITGINNGKYINLEPLKKEIIDLYIELEYNLYQIGNLFGVNKTTISKRLKKWNIETRDSLFYGTKKNGYKTDDGHIVKSNVEREISNFLFYNDIVYIYDKMLNYGRYKCDFFIPIGIKGIYVEYWGLIGNKRYEEKMEKKKEIYKKLGLNLLSIYPSDNIFEKLRPLLKYSRTQKQVTDFETEGGDVIKIVKDE